MVQAKRIAVQKLFNDAAEVLSYRRHHRVAVDEQSLRLVEKVERLLQNNPNEQISIEQDDLTAVHELARVNHWIHGHWLPKLFQTHVVASWLAAIPMAVAGLITDERQSLAIAMAAPLIAGLLVYVYLPYRLLGYGISLLLTVVRPSPRWPQLIVSEDFVIVFVMLAAAFVLPMLWPSWLIVRRWRTGRAARGVWIIVGFLLALQIGLLTLKRFGIFVARS